MTKIFVVTDGDYSDYHIVTVCSTRERANRVVEVFGVGSVEEFEVDSIEINKGLLPFFVRLDADGNALQVQRSTSTYGFSESESYRDIKGNFFTHVFAMDEEHAKKIAGERKLQYSLTH